MRWERNQNGNRSEQWTSHWENKYLFSHSSQERVEIFFPARLDETNFPSEDIFSDIFQSWQGFANLKHEQPMVPVNSARTFPRSKRHGQQKKQKKIIRTDLQRTAVIYCSLWKCVISGEIISLITNKRNKVSQGCCWSCVTYVPEKWLDLTFWKISTRGAAAATSWST